MRLLILIVSIIIITSCNMISTVGTGNYELYTSQIARVHLIDDDSDINQFQSITDRDSAYTYKGKFHRTYTVFMGNTNLQIYVKYYDHDTNEYSEAVPWGYAQLGAQDTHAHPCISVTRDGYIVVVQEELNGTALSAHNSDHQIRRSDSPEDISTWTQIAKIGNDSSYPHLTNVGDSTLMYFTRYSTERIGVLRTEDRGDTWVDFVGSPTTQLFNSVNVELANFEGLNLWLYHDVYELEEGFSVTIRPREKREITGQQGYPFAYMLFSRDGITYGNWEWYVSDGVLGVSKNLSTGAFDKTTLDANYVVVGNPGIITNTLAGFLSRPFILGDKLYFVSPVGTRVANVDVFTEYNLHIVNSDGSEVIKPMIANNRDLSVTTITTPMIFPMENGNIKMWTNNTTGSGILGEYQTNDRGENWFLVHDYDTAIVNLWNERRLSYSYKTNTLVFSLPNPTSYNHRVVVNNIK